MKNFFLVLGGHFILTYKIAKEAVRPPFEMRALTEQLLFIGYLSLPLVIVSAICTGMVMALQFGAGLGRFGGTLYVPRIVTVSIFREMGPVFTSLILAARVSASMAAEIGSMNVTQQVDAMRAMGTSPIRKIVVPRVLASLISIPILVVFANILGFFGGLIVGATELRLDPYFYTQKALSFLEPGDYLSGIGKAVFFALFISIPACYFGMNVREGTKGVGLATTQAVVTASTLILVGDFLLTKLFLILETWS